ncbi:hypothetical protein FO519_010928, partial [Halicephalobus sp. NKZ332]
HKYFDREDHLFCAWWTPVFDNDLVLGNSFIEAAETAPVIPILYGMNSNEEAGFVIDVEHPFRNSKYYPMGQEEGMSFGKEKFIKALTHLFSLGNFYGNRSEEAIQKVIDFYLTRGDENPP